MKTKQRDWRSASPRNSTRALEKDLREDTAAKPPVMQRTRMQLATSYAPGRLFTWQGGRGICYSTPLSDPAVLDETKRAMIAEGMKELTENWAARARQCRPQAGPVNIELCLDEPFFDREGNVSIDILDEFEYTRPSRVGYVPYPLLYQCQHSGCGRLLHYETVEQQARSPLPRKCGDHNPRWRQVDVVFVHWSGGLEPLTPFSNQYSPGRGVSKIERCQCGSDEFALVNRGNTFSEWYFKCMGCPTTRELKQQDAHTLSILKPRMDSGESHEWIEINMLPVSYRANPVHYVQGGRFIVLQDARVVELMKPDRQEELIAELARIHHFDYQAPSIEEIRDALQQHGREAELQVWQKLGEEADRNEKASPEIAKKFREMADAQYQQWQQGGYITKGRLTSTALPLQVQLQGDWARRYNPIRLTIEHDVLVKEHIENKLKVGEACDVLNPDRNLCDAVGDPARENLYKKNISRLLTRLGIERMVLIRKLPICEYTFGYTRVSATPVYERHYNGRDVPMPVRLMAFPRMSDGGKRPIYAMEQENEALYIRLSPAQVYAWLQENGIAVPASEQLLGAAYIEDYQDFGAFLDRFKVRESSDTPRTLHSYVYMLLHSMAHQIIHALAELSGLDRDNIGEHIFPADLSFVVYRRGMTPDLGNISAMWRNYAEDFLKRIADARLLRCGSGSLCDQRGCACPACIMLSDISCIAYNQLLSRATLCGGARPLWEDSSATRELHGFFPLINRKNKHGHG